MFSKDTTSRYTPDFNIMIKIAILNSLGFFFMGFLIPIISRQQMNATGLEIGLIISAMVIGFTISSSFVGIITDRIKSKKRYLIFIGSIGRGFSYLIFYLSIIINALVGMWIGMFILGFFAGFFWIPFDTLIAEKSNKNHRSQAFGKRDSANATGQIIGGLIGFGILLSMELFTDNPYYVYSAILIFGIANFIAGILFLKFVDESIRFSNEKNSKEESEKDLGFSLFKLPKPMLVGLLILFLVVLLASINGNLAKPFLNIYIIENLSDNLYIVILIYLPSGLLATFLAPKLGQMVDKLEPRIAIVILSLSGAIVTWFLINTKDLILFAILLLIDITVAISAGLLFRNLLSRITIEHRGKILGICSFFVNMGSIIGPILGGYVWDVSGPKAPFIVSIFVELCLIPLYFIVIHLLLPHVAETYEKDE